MSAETSIETGGRWPFLGFLKARRTTSVAASPHVGSDGARPLAAAGEEAEAPPPACCRSVADRFRASSVNWASFTAFSLSKTTPTVIPSAFTSSLAGGLVSCRSGARYVRCDDGFLDRGGFAFAMRSMSEYTQKRGKGRGVNAQAGAGAPGPAHVQHEVGEQEVLAGEHNHPHARANGADDDDGCVVRDPQKRPNGCADEYQARGGISGEFMPYKGMAAPADGAWQAHR